MNRIIVGLSLTFLLVLPMSKIWSMSQKTLAKSGIKYLTGLQIKAHSDTVNSAAFNKTATKIVTASDDGTAQIWELNNNKWICNHILKGHAEAVNSAAFDVTETKIVTASDDGTARIWELDGNKWVYKSALQHQNSTRQTDVYVNSAAFDATGSKIVTTTTQSSKTESWDEARVWELDGNKWVCKHLLDEFMSIEGSINSAEFNRTGTKIVISSRSGKHAVVWVLKGEAWVRKETLKNPFNIATAYCVPPSNYSLGKGDPVFSAAFDRTGTKIVTATGQTVQVWDFFDSAFDCIASPEWHCTAVSERENYNIRSAAFNEKGTRIVTSSFSDKTAKVWGFKGRFLFCEAILKGHSMDVTSAVFNQSGTQIVTASEDKTIRVWELADLPEPLETQHSSHITQGASQLSPSYQEKTQALGALGPRNQNVIDQDLIVPTEEQTNLSTQSNALSADLPESFDSSSMLLEEPKDSVLVPQLPNNTSSSTNSSSVDSTSLSSYTQQHFSHSPTSSTSINTVNNFADTNIHSHLDSESLSRQALQTQYSSNVEGLTGTILAINSLTCLPMSPSDLKQEIERLTPRTLEIENQKNSYRQKLNTLNKKRNKNRKELDQIAMLEKRIKLLEDASSSELLHQKALTEFNDDLNLLMFYKTLLCVIESAFISYKSAAGGVVETKQESGGTKESVLGMASTGIQLLGSVISFIPGVTWASLGIAGIINGITKASLEKLNKKKQELIQRVNMLMEMHGASEVAITVAHNITKRYSDQLKALLTHKFFEIEMNKIAIQAPTWKKRLLVIKKLLKKAGNNISSDFDGESLMQQLISPGEVDFGNISGVGGRFIVNLLESLSSSSQEDDLVPFAQVAAEYAAVHVLTAITTLKKGMELKTIIEYLESSIHDLIKEATHENSRPNTNIFSILKAKFIKLFPGVTLSTINAPTKSVSVLIRTSTPTEINVIKEINVHDLFAFPEVWVADQLHHGKMDLVDLHSAKIEASPSSSSSASSSISQMRVGPPPTYSTPETRQERAWNFFDTAVKDKKFSEQKKIVLLKMIAKEDVVFLARCTKHASYKSVLEHWQVLLEEPLNKESSSSIL